MLRGKDLVGYDWLKDGWAVIGWGNGRLVLVRDDV